MLLWPSKSSSKFFFDLQGLKNEINKDQSSIDYVSTTHKIFKNTKKSATLKISCTGQPDGPNL